MYVWEGWGDCNKRKREREREREREQGNWNIINIRDYYCQMNDQALLFHSLGICLHVLR